MQHTGNMGISLYHRLMIFAIFDLSPLSLWMNGILRLFVLIPDYSYHFA